MTINKSLQVIDYTTCNDLFNSYHYFSLHNKFTGNAYQL